MLTTSFDIETEPLPQDKLLELMPEFKAAANLRDPAKIAADIEEKRQSWLEKAALDPITGKVLAVGFRSEEHGEALFHGHGEVEILKEFWWKVSKTTAETSGGCCWVGFHSAQFDLPFLINRSRIKRVQIPAGVREGRYWGHAWIDLREVWNCGRKDQSGSLDSVARALGVGRKSGSGADFAKLYREDQAKALAYLSNDLTLTLNVAKVLL